MTAVRPGGPWQRGRVQEVGHVECRLPVHATVVALARQLTRSVSRAWPDKDSCDAVLLVLSELLGNAVKAAVGTSVWLRLSWTPRRVRIEVADDSGALPVPRQAGVHEEGGRGLWLVSQMAVRWGSHPVGQGKCVWAEVALPA